ncbi:AraC-like transcriptional regulator QhpR [Azospirillum sp. B510]|uniref:AraC-like transcriptional regulator QhpR n=1 Tax=Azospirillum sp. (strain B510) TaxID=137722 RepID=UPI0002ED8535|nr:AraC family transcriptional regulator [Azospirillum sp. B510]
MPKTHSSADEPKIWAMVTQSLIDALKNKGHAPDTLLGRFGLSEATPADPYREIPLRNYVSAFEAAATHVADSNFGLSAARNLSPLTLGPVGLLFTSAPTLGAALKGFIEYNWLVQQGTTCAMARDGGSCVFRYRIEDRRIFPRRHDAEFSLAMVVEMIRALAGGAWRPQEVHFEHAAPANLQAHNAFFKAPLYFNQPANELIFPAADLAIAGSGVDHRVSGLVEHYLGMLRQRSVPTRSLEDKVRRMASDHFPGDGGFGVASTAQALGVSPSTLQRSLRKSGESFSAIKQDRRRALTENYLVQSDLSITEITHILGYADGACFTRACRRWFGMTPSMYRKLHRKDNPAADGEPASGA